MTSRTALLIALTGLASACAPKIATIHAFQSGPDGFDTQTYWIDTGREVVVVDTQFTPALAEQMLAEIRATTSSPVTHAVITHPNPDKFNGARVFQDAGAVLVAAESTWQAMPGVHAYKEAYFTSVGTFATGQYPAMPTVDQTFTGQLSLATQVPIELVVLDNPGVSSTQTVVRVGSQVLVGDLVAGGVHAWLEGGIVDGVAQPDLDAWARALDELQTLVGDDTIVHPGRGTSGRAGDLLPAQRAYLTQMDALVRTYVDDVGVAALAEDGAPHWDALTLQAESEFPDLGLSYLVTYGVYGLAFSNAD